MSDRCSACAHKFHCIMGDGPAPCRAVLIGQNPGKTEEAQAARGEIPRVFVGDAGKETNEHYLLLAGLTRSEDVYLTNVLKCHTDNDRKPSPKEINACSKHFLPGELERHNPEIVVLMGSPACSIVPEINLETHRGFPKKVNLFGVMRWVYPVNHPASGMHDTSMMSLLMEDFSHLRDVLGGDYSCPVDEYPNPDYRDLTGDHEQIRYVLELGLSRGERFLARDTEFLQDPPDTGPKIPFCSTFTVIPGTGYMIREIDRDGLRILGEYILKYKGLLHNALADLDVEEAMGLPYNPDYDDTMQLAAQQQDLSQKLKVLAWRLSGMIMKSYEDVVMPYSRTAVLEYLEEAFDIASMKKCIKTIPMKYKVSSVKAVEGKMAQIRKKYGDTPVGITVGKDGLWDGLIHFNLTEEVDSPLTKKLLHLHTHTAKPVPEEGTPYNPWQSFKEQVEEEFTPEEVFEIKDRLGELPKASIAQVFNRNSQAAIYYASRDSCATRRIHPVLEQRAERYHGRVMAGDIDR